MTKLSKPVSRETGRKVGSRAVIVTLAPASSTNDALIGFRLKGTRTTYVCALSDVYRTAALWHGAKLARAKSLARKNGESWASAKKQFNRENTINENGKHG